MIKIDSESWAIRARGALIAKLIARRSRRLRGCGLNVPNERGGRSFAREKKPTLTHPATDFAELDFGFHLPLTS